MSLKRKASLATSVSPRKFHPETEEVLRYDLDRSRIAEKFGIIQRQYYPPQISNERCALYSENEIPRPIDTLENTIHDTAGRRNIIEVGDAVMHWFKRDLRITDNRALSLASILARSKDVPLICLFIISPQDYQAHLTSAVRVDFELRTLQIIKQDLAELNIPLYVDVIETRKKNERHIINLAKQWNARHIFCNIEYEVDELRRETRLIKACLQEGISFTAVHDDVIVNPGIIKPAQRYTPWFKSWLAHIQTNPFILDSYPRPVANHAEIVRAKYGNIFEAKIPPAPSNKRLTEEEMVRFEKIWPAGEHEARSRLDKFLDEKIREYKGSRNFPAANGTAILSVHFSTGTLAARTVACRLARNIDTDDNTHSWISEIAWREFYKQILIYWPFVCMNKAFKYESTDIEWEYNSDHFQKWCTGNTGFPFVDAAMRQLNFMGWMHNRARMTVASFLAKNLLIDWRMGEQYFMERLVDGDFASNSGGWGFCISPFRTFNPLLQGDKFDPDGSYIRKWVPELRGIQGSAIHDPYHRGAEKLVAGVYPRQIVDLRASRERATLRYKKGII